jgi:hypothetical protein
MINDYAALNDNQSHRQWNLDMKDRFIGVAMNIFKAFREDFAHFDTNPFQGMSHPVFLALSRENSDLRRELDTAKQTLVGMSEQVAGLNQQVVGLNQQVAGLNQQITGLSKQITVVNPQQLQPMDANLSGASVDVGQGDGETNDADRVGGKARSVSQVGRE